MFAATQRASTNEDMSGEMQNAAADIRGQGKRIKGDVREAADAIKDDAKHVAREAGHQLREVFDNAENKVVDAAKAVSAEIHKEPLISSAVALGIGVIVGALFFRR